VDAVGTTAIGSVLGGGARKGRCGTPGIRTPEDSGTMPGEAGIGGAGAWGNAGDGKNDDEAPVARGVVTRG